MSAAENIDVSHADEVVNWDGEEPPDPDGDIPMTEDNNPVPPAHVMSINAEATPRPIAVYYIISGRLSLAVLKFILLTLDLLLSKAHQSSVAFHRKFIHRFDS